jgi:hypothetical protein
MPTAFSKNLTYIACKLNICCRLLVFFKAMKVSSSQSHTLLIVETDTNGESKVLSWWVFWAYCASARDFCPALSGL